jgi:hypothetical protein
VAVVAVELLLAVVVRVDIVLLQGLVLRLVLH